MLGTEYRERKIDRERVERERERKKENIYNKKHHTQLY